METIGYTTYEPINLLFSPLISVVMFEFVYASIGQLTFGHLFSNIFLFADILYVILLSW
jgi:hypothetical protein